MVPELGEQDRQHRRVVIRTDPLALLVLLHQAAHQGGGAGGGLHAALGGLDGLEAINLIAQHQLLLFREDRLLLGRADCRSRCSGRRSDQGRYPGEGAEQQQRAAESCVHGEWCEEWLGWINPG